MHETGCSGMVHWDDPEGWDGKGGGSGVQDGEHMGQGPRVMQHRMDKKAVIHVHNGILLSH